MRTLLQVVSEAYVSVDGEVIANIDQGLLVFVGVDASDTPEKMQRMAERVLSYRAFADDTGRMNRNVQHVNGELLVVSQFTLVADTDNGHRPSFSKAMSAEPAKLLFQQFVDELHASYPRIKEGRFQAQMQVSLVNEGPVTFLLES
jgi:D-tyrosyl-tRNA(Tyr) deacylase